MLQRHESNELLKKLEAYTDAWEAYVKAIADNDQSRYGKGAHVVNLGEGLKKYIKEELS